MSREEVCPLLGEEVAIAQGSGVITCPPAVQD